MDTLYKIFSAIILFAAPYLITISAYHWIAPELSFSLHREALGATMSSYSGTLIAVLIAALTFMLGIKNNNFAKMQRYGYMLSIITLYALIFVELGILFFIGILLISNLDIAFLPSVALIISTTSFLHLCLLTIQLINLASKK